MAIQIWSGWDEVQKLLSLCNHASLFALLYFYFTTVIGQLHEPFSSANEKHESEFTDLQTTLINVAADNSTQSAHCMARPHSATKSVHLSRINNA
jgi:hypothetical protein